MVGNEKCTLEAEKANALGEQEVITDREVRSCPDEDSPTGILSSLSRLSTGHSCTPLGPYEGYNDLLHVLESCTGICEV
jgi:hypothetical protein